MILRVQTVTQRLIDLSTSQRIARLQSRLGQRFELLTEAIQIGPLRVTFTRVADPETVLNELCDRIDAHEKRTGQRLQGDQLGLPYWAELWDSSIGVGQWLLRYRDQQFKAEADTEHRNGDIQPIDKRFAPTVLDLGCGMGLAGTVAAMLGARVTFGDIERDCLLFACLNGLRYNGQVRARRIDWEKDDLNQRFDLIIGSDVLYDRIHWQPLDAFCKRHLTDTGTVILGEPGRMTGDLWIDWIANRGWNLHTHIEQVPTRKTPIRLFELVGGGV